MTESVEKRVRRRKEETDGAMVGGMVRRVEHFHPHLEIVVHGRY